METSRITSQILLTESEQAHLTQGDFHFPDHLNSPFLYFFQFCICLILNPFIHTRDCIIHARITNILPMLETFFNKLSNENFLPCSQDTVSNFCMGYFKPSRSSIQKLNISDEVSECLKNHFYLLYFIQGLIPTVTLDKRCQEPVLHFNLCLISLNYQCFHHSLILFAWHIF